MRFIGQLLKIGKNYYSNYNGQLVKLDNSRPNRLVQTSKGVLTGEYYGTYLRAKEIRRIGNRLYQLYVVGESYKRLTRKEVKQFTKLKED